MEERSAQWCENLLPLVPHRQWVLTVPWSRRALLAYRPELAHGVLAEALHEVFGWLKTRAEEQHGVTDAQCGAVTVEQRFDSSLALNLHYHSIVPDGVFARDAGGTVRFHRVSPTRGDVDDLARRIALRCETWLAPRLDQHEEPDPDDTQAVLVAASADGRVAAGERAGQAVRRVRGAEPEEAAGRGSIAGGYGLHAGTWVPATDRVGLQHLARYLLRPPLAKGRLEERPDGQVVLHLRKAWRDGTSAFVFSPMELTEKLAALVVRPRTHTVHFHGVFAAHAAWRAEVVPDPTALAERKNADSAIQAAKLVRRRTRRRRGPSWSAWCPWSELLERVFGEGGFRCPHCGKPMTLRTVVTAPDAAARILASLRRSARGPPAASSSP